MRVRMKNLMGVMEGGSIPALNNLEDALNAEQKVLSFTYVAVTLSGTVLREFIFLGQ